MFVLQLHQLDLNICLIPLPWDCVSISTQFCGTLIVGIVQKFAAIFTSAILGRYPIRPEATSLPPLSSLEDDETSVLSCSTRD